MDVIKALDNGHMVRLSQKRKDRDLRSDSWDREGSPESGESSSYKRKNKGLDESDEEYSEGKTLKPDCRHSPGRQLSHPTVHDTHYRLFVFDCL